MEEEAVNNVKFEKQSKDILSKLKKHVLVIDNAKKSGVAAKLKAGVVKKFLTQAATDLKKGAKVLEKKS